MSCDIPVPIGKTCPVCQTEHSNPKRKIGNTLILIGVVGVLSLIVYLNYRYKNRPTWDNNWGYGW
jgi:hypothetical protein